MMNVTVTCGGGGGGGGGGGNGGILIAQAQNSYTFVIDDVDYPVWAEVSCPDPTSPTGYGEPIRSEPTPIISDPNNTPWYPLVNPTALSITFEYTGSITNRIICSSGDPGTDLIATDTLGPFNIGSVVEWRVVNLAAEFSTTCGPNVSGEGIVCAIQTKNAAGVISSTTVQANSVAISGGVSQDVSVVRTITSLKYDGFEMGYPPGS